MLMLPTLMALMKLMGVLIHLALWWEELQKVRILDQPVCGCTEAYNCSFKPGSGLRQK